ncbi:MAG: hypothetical protein GVY33_14550 [Alphaproteobacteria bacterium]|nr:hypothetical protein [Alphaproteobacteria bacterium]
MADDTGATSEGLAEAPAAGFVFDPTVLDKTTPDYLIPKMDQYPVSDPAYYKQLVLLDPRGAGEGASELETALDPFAPVDALPAPQRPLQGVLITYEQAWRQSGLALGRLVHSLCLAPGEVTKIAVMDFTRRTAGTSAEAATQGERVVADTEQGSSVQEVRESVAKDAQSGSSTQSSIASQAQAGVSGGGLLVSGSASSSLNTGFGVSTSSSASSARLRADGARRMQQNTIATSQAVRSRRATQVREVSETESQTATSRVIANYNHMHALTVMFFEVVQIFELKTRAADAERVVFIPMRAAAFTDALVREHWSALARILRAAGLSYWADRLNTFIGADTVSLRLAFETARARFRDRMRALQAAFEKSRDIEIDFDDPDEYKVQLVFAGFDFQLDDARENDPAALETAEAQRAIARRQAAETAYRAYLESKRAYDSARDVVLFLDANRLWFNQLLWMELTPGHVQRLVANRTFQGTSLAHLMDPRPLAAHGNYVAFRLPHATPGGDAAFANRYTQQPDDNEIPEDFIALPSGGVFGEAVLGQSVAAEKIDLTRFWNWQESPIPILPPAMRPLDLASRARGMEFARVDLDAALAQLLDVQVPDGVDLDAITAQVKANVRDMSGRGELAALLGAQVGAARDGAATAGAQAVQTGANIRDVAVDLANSALARVAATAVTAKGGAASATVLGGVLGGSRPASGHGAAGGNQDPGAGT